MLLRLLGILAVGGALAAAAPVAVADDGDILPGRSYASSYGPVPNMPVTVKPWDNSAANLRVKSSFTDALSRHGVRLAETGTPLFLNFETEIESLAAPSLGPTLGQVQGRNWDSRVRMNLWSNAQDSVLAGRRSTDSGRTVRYILRATLDDQRTGQRLWQAEATYTGAPADESNAFSAMAPVVVEGFGQNVRPKGFRLE